ncbi:extracellular solute-binding protein [Eisenbergiella sp.]
MKYKKSISLLLSAVLYACVLCGCGAQDTEQNLPVGAAENEIIAYQPVADDKMLITVRAEYNGMPENLDEIIETKFPDVDIVLRLHASSNDSDEIGACLDHQDFEDIIFSWGISTTDGERLEDNFVDLSSKGFVSNYYTSVLNSCAYNGHLYFLPGPSKIQGIVYDKTLFDEHGWQVPASLDEYLALCKTIQEETDLHPADFTFKWASGLSVVLNTWAYGEVLAGDANYQWLQKYAAGEESMIGHMEPMFELFQKLLDAGAITEGAFTREPWDRSVALYSEHTTAMTSETQMAPTYARQLNSDHQYGMMPFWCGSDPDSDYLSVESTYNIAVNKKLEAEGNEARYDKVMEIIEWFSTPEGQQDLIGDMGMTISSVKDIPMVSTDFTKNIEATIDKGHLAPKTDYTRASDSREFYKTFHQGFWNIAKGIQTPEDVMRDCDARVLELLQTTQEEKPKRVYGTAAEDFSRLETGLYIADALRRAMGTDLSIILVGKASCGTLSRIYQGDVTETELRNIGLDTFDGEDPDFNKFAVTTMTGAQIIEILQYSFEDTPEQQSTFTCFVTSGLKVEYAPWAASGEHLVKVTGEDDSEFDLNNTYTVSYCNGSFTRQGNSSTEITEPLIPGLEPEKVYQETIVELLGPVVQGDGEIRPFTDGRLVLNWDIIGE